MSMALLQPLGRTHVVCCTLRNGSSGELNFVLYTRKSTFLVDGFGFSTCCSGCIWRLGLGGAQLESVFAHLDRSSSVDQIARGLENGASNTNFI